MPLLAPPALIPSKLALVNAALSQLKQPPITTLVNAKPLTLAMGDAVDDCVNDIYSRTSWRFMLRTYAIQMVAEQQFYSIPADFGLLYSKGITAANLFIPYEEADTFDITSTTPYGIPGEQSGQPIAFTMRDFVSFKFYPKPDAGFVAAFPILELQYYCTAQPILDENQSPFLPYAFKQCVVNYLLYRWMKTNEYGMQDLGEAEKQYEKSLNYLLSRDDPAPNSHRMKSGFRLNGGRSPNVVSKVDPLGGYGR